MPYCTYLWLCATLGLSLSGCSLTGPDTSWTAGPREVPGIIQFYGETSRVDLSSDAVETGEPLSITIATFGGGCEQTGGARASVRGLVATVRVFDYTVADQVDACTLELKLMERTVVVRFDRPGEAVLRIEGQRIDRSADRGTPAVIERTVVVH